MMESPRRAVRSTPDNAVSDTDDVVTTVHSYNHNATRVHSPSLIPVGPRPLFFFHSSFFSFLLSFLFLSSSGGSWSALCVPAFFLHPLPPPPLSLHPIDSLRL